ncbi:transposase [Streptomyces sp. NPDC007875]|uniref:transposase n=1 Tax=Streptomyces sp. NPDC007875 TaxID=3364783 RepID=UPI003683033A
MAITELALNNGETLHSQAGSVLLAEMVRKSVLNTAISAALTPWRKPRAVHDPGKILLNVALAVALGGGCLADIGMLRAEPDVRPGGFRSHSLPCHRQTRRIRPESPRGDPGRTFPSTGRVWELAGANSPATDGQVIVDIGGVLTLAHSEKQDATATRKKAFGHHPLVAFVDHGQAGSGEPVAALLRPGNAGSNTAADHIETARLALAQLLKALRLGRQTLILTDSGGSIHA